MLKKKDKCRFLEKCVFFNDLMKDMPAGVKVYKRDYCLADHTKCARYRVAVMYGKKAVPFTLFPYQEEEADEVIRDLGDNAV